MNAEERKALKDRCDALIREFDAAHPEIAAAVKMRELGRGPRGGNVGHGLTLGGK